MSKSKLTIICLFFSLGKIKAQTGKGVWVNYSNIIHPTSAFHFRSDFSFRRFENESKSKTNLLRGCIAWNVSPSFDAGLGIAHLGKTVGGNQSHELRFLQYFKYENDLSPIYLTYRARLEQRNISFSKDEVEDIFQMRIRNLIRFELPILETDESVMLSLILGNEVFLKSSGSFSPYNFDQNRVVVGPSLHCSVKCKVALLYKYQLKSQDLTPELLKNHIIRLNVTHQIGERS